MIEIAFAGLSVGASIAIAYLLFTDDPYGAWEP